MGKLIVAGDMMKCSFGAAPSPLAVLPAKKVISGTPVATIMDMAPGANIATFGMCSAPTNPMVIAATAKAAGVFTPQPCTPMVAGPWVPGSLTVLVGGQPALNNTCVATCMWAGVIQFAGPGQSTVQVGN